jgi:hypothetical protein
MNVGWRVPLLRRATLFRRDALQPGAHGWLQPCVKEEAMKKLLWVLIGIGLLAGIGCMASEGIVTLKLDNPDGKAVPFIIWYKSNLTDSTLVSGSTPWQEDLTVETSGDKVEGWVFRADTDSSTFSDVLDFEILFNGKQQEKHSITYLMLGAQFFLTIQRGM